MIPAEKTQFGHVVITGASSGIGEALALRYSHIPGIFLSLTGRDAARLEAVAMQCRAAGAEVKTRTVDVTDAGLMKSWIEDADEWRPIDIIIANAGISAGTAGLQHGESREQVDRLFAVNVNGVLNTVDPALERMIARGRGHIALVSSLAAFRGWPGAPAYCASKAAVKVYGEGLAGTIAHTGVQVHVICPGFVTSRMTDANDYAMPFKISAGRAAVIIERGIAQGRGRIAFPFISYCIVQLIGLLPDFLAQKLLARLPQKSS